MSYLPSKWSWRICISGTDQLVLFICSQIECISWRLDFNISRFPTYIHYPRFQNTHSNGSNGKSLIILGRKLRRNGFWRLMHDSKYCSDRTICLHYWWLVTVNLFKHCIYSEIILNRIVRWSIVPYIDVLSRNDMHSFILDWFMIHGRYQILTYDILVQL